MQKMIRALWSRWWLPAILIFLAGPGFRATGAGAGSSPGDVRSLSLRLEVRHAIDRGVEWMEARQSDEGYWSTVDHPAISGLVLVALQGDPSFEANKDVPRQQRIRKGYAYLLDSVQPDGGIYRKKGLTNYNTSICVLALLAAGKPEYDSVILKARDFLIGLQWDFGKKGQTDDPLDGGIGYGNRYRHSDMSNTLHALEAIYYSSKLIADKDPSKVKRLNWSAAIEFLQRCQNLPSHNPLPWASDDPQNRGGFVYFPGDSKAGEMVLPDGRTALRSYGSISYAGLLSYIYAKLKPDDPRVAAVFDWLRRNYTLVENPGMGPQGLYFYYHTMTKALTAYGVDELKLENGETHRWRQELALKLINLQDAKGDWRNKNARWWENDPVLVTAYALISLEMIEREL